MVDGRAVPGDLVSAYPGEDGWTRVVPLHPDVGGRVACCYLEEGCLGVVLAVVRARLEREDWALVLGPGGRCGWSGVGELDVHGP